MSKKNNRKNVVDNVPGTPVVLGVSVVGADEFKAVQPEVAKPLTSVDMLEGFYPPSYAKLNVPGTPVNCNPWVQGLLKGTGVAVQGVTETPSNLPGAPRYNLFGHPITSILRWYGSQGYTAKPVTAALGKLGVVCAPATVSTQLQHGKHNRGNLPTLTAEQINELEAAIK